MFRIGVIVRIAYTKNLMRFWIRNVKGTVERTYSDVISIGDSGSTVKKIFIFINILFYSYVLRAKQIESNNTISYLL